MHIRLRALPSLGPCFAALSKPLGLYWVKVHFRKALTDLLNASVEEAAETANQYVNFDGHTRRPSLYDNYKYRGARLKYLCFYEYASQIFVQTFKGARGRVFCFPFETAHPLPLCCIYKGITDAILMW
jgi:hypothetical protein